jgi:hypothetical protein
MLSDVVAFKGDARRSELPPDSETQHSSTCVLAVLDEGPC